jgi:hypothetical protein
MLRQRPAAIVERGVHLHLRVHVLRQLRGLETRFQMPELWRGASAATDSPSYKAGQVSRLDEAYF